MPDFPHMNDTSQFPGVNNIDVYTYDNDFDYGRYSPDVTIELLRVPWDSEYQNVVDFGTSAARDKWFKAQDLYKVSLTNCMCKIPTEEINVPLPYNEAMRYDYIHITRGALTSAAAPVQYETQECIKDWFYFIIEATPLATNSTRLVLAIDWFTTFWYSANHPFCYLNRGHYPMAQVTPAQFLSSPLTTNRWLLCPDINYDSPSQVVSYSDYVFNGTSTWALIACSSTVTGTWATDSGEGRTPSAHYYNIGGVPSYNVFACSPDNLSILISWIGDNRPQMLQTIKGIYFISSDLLNQGTTFTLGTVTCWSVTTQTKNLQLMNFGVGDFNIPTRYKNIAKLYTYPYSVIEITDGRGNVTQIRVEDSNGTISAQAALSIALPYLGIDVAITSVGALNSRSVIFKNLTQKSRTLTGDWYKTLMHWDIPIYGIFQGAYTFDTFAHVWERDSATYSAQNALDSAVESANTAQTNVANSGAAQTANTATMTALNAGNVSRSNAASTEITTIGNATSQAAQAYDAGLQRGVQQADADTVAATTITNAIGNLASSIATGQIVGGIAGVIGGVCEGVNAAVMLNAASEKVELSITNSQDKVTSQNTSNTSITSQNTTTQTNNVSASNTAQTSITSKNVATANTNATNSKNTAVNNANRSKNSATRSITNGRKANYLKPALEFGSRVGSSQDIDSPQLMTTCILTQKEGALTLAGDAMLKYGYTFDGQVDSTNLNVCQKFAYWQGDMSIIPREAGMSAGAISALKQIFSQGTTVYKLPEYIGVSIYDNGF